MNIIEQMDGFHIYSITKLYSLDKVDSVFESPTFSINRNFSAQNLGSLKRPEKLRLCRSERKEQLLRNPISHLLCDSDPNDEVQNVQYMQILYQSKVQLDDPEDSVQENTGGRRAGSGS